MMASRGRIGVAGVEPWDPEWAAERAAEALRYLGTHYPECLEVLRVLDEHETAPPTKPPYSGTGKATSLLSGPT